MKKIIILLIATTFLFSGCTVAERGLIDTSKNIEVYYYKTEYIEQPFYVLSDAENDDGSHTVTFTIDDEIDFKNGIYTEDVEPNSIVEFTFNEQEYKSQIDGMEVFETSLYAYTFVFPTEETTKYCNYVTFEDTSVKLVATEALKLKGLEQPFNEDYIRKWKFNWIKI